MTHISGDRGLYLSRSMRRVSRCPVLSPHIPGVARGLVRTNCFKPGRDFLVTHETVHRDLLLAWEPLGTQEWWQVRPPYAPLQQHKVKQTFKGVS